MRNTIISANGAVDLVATAHSEEGKVVFVIFAKGAVDLVATAYTEEGKVVFVISANAEIQRARDEYFANALDSRFRGNDVAVQ